MSITNRWCWSGVTPTSASRITCPYAARLPPAKHYQYDALCLMSFRSPEGDPASKVVIYSYDAAGRLICSQHRDHAHRYSEE
ncbi:hypothetical protein [Vreelandella boliviensis]|uniref:hypothetical protein n=1 Tax=Vreelandella boliviensis TaxID=223527 RepID=UPI001B8CEE47|nr:hypothetical protein [Halomonas boliviensis]MBS3670318.1 hypothetical protein [Halomonas boliviensis]